jgi:hypothetical protein
MANIKYADDPEKRAKYLSYFKRVYEVSKEEKRLYKIDWASIPENKVHLILNGIKYRCKKDNIPFDITIEDLMPFPTHCKYLGWELTTIHGEGRVDTNMSIDKINPELGYVKGNVQIISDMANRMKNSATKEQLITFATNVLKELS